MVEKRNSRWNDLKRDLLAANSNGNPAMAKAIAKYGIRRDGRRDWAGFVRWLEERILRKNRNDCIPAEVPHTISAEECSTDGPFHTRKSSTISGATEDASP
jgi:hypothetical protein